jgi:hypothetical protein
MVQRRRIIVSRVDDRRQVVLIVRLDVIDPKVGTDLWRRI